MTVVATYATSAKSTKRKFIENILSSIKTGCKSIYPTVVINIMVQYMGVTYFLINPNLMKLGSAWENQVFLTLT
jgi:hypothetical protein